MVYRRTPAVVTSASRTTARASWRPRATWWPKAAGAMPTSRPSPRRPASPPAPSIATSPPRPSCSPRCWPTSRGRERDVLAAIVDGDGTPAARLKGAVQAFSSRALRGRRLAYAMIVGAVRARDRQGPPRVARGAGRGVRAPDRDGPGSRARSAIATRALPQPASSAPSWRRWWDRWRRTPSPMREDAQRLHRRDRRRLPGDRRQARRHVHVRRDREDGMSQTAPPRGTHAGAQSGQAGDRMERLQRRSPARRRWRTGWRHG